MTDRRRFLAAAAALPAAAAARRLLPQRSEPLYRISLAQWSLHRTLRRGDLDPLDFPKTAKEDFGIEAVEYVSTFYAGKAGDEDHLREMKTRADDHGVRSLLIMVDGEGALGDPDEGKRRDAVQRHVKWLDAARALGCHSIRVNARSGGTWEEQRDRAADGLQSLAERGAGRGLHVLVENHGGLSSNGRWLAEVIRTAGHPRLGTLPDFGNFQIRPGVSYDRYKGVKELMPFARAVSAKSHAFDEDGNEVRTDYRRMMRIVVGAGYDGFVGIEYEGSEHSEPEGIRLTRRLLERVRTELAEKR